MLAFTSKVLQILLSRFPHHSGNFLMNQLEWIADSKTKIKLIV